jgi:hypothetical protein
VPYHLRRRLLMEVRITKQRVAMAALLVLAGIGQEKSF